jgi:myo-inositol 2-dehydrogenase/D-chiro-inositol 1-dehydrogenase
VNKALNIAVIGAGFIGRVHAQCIANNPRTQISSIFDVDEGACSQVATKHSARVASSLHEAVVEADAVIIGTPTSTHGEISRLCIQEKTPFICEKPLDTNLVSALRTASAAAEVGVFAGMGLNRRFDQQYSQLHSAIKRGDLGKIEMVLMTSRTPTLQPAKYVATSGGLLRDKGAHWFDLVCWLSGERPKEIYVAGSCLIDPRFAEFNDIDTAAITLTMESGVLCQLDFSRRTAYGNDERVEVAGSEGMMQSRTPNSSDVAFYQGDTVKCQGVHQDWYSRIQNTYPTQLDAFVDAISGNGDFPTLTDGLVAETIAIAGNLSLEHGAPVPITYDAIEGIAA